MNKKHTVERFVMLRKKGFTNKQIAVYWNKTLMQIAGVHAWATRKGMSLV
jgi:hypothetical protein